MKSLMENLLINEKKRSRIVLQYYLFEDKEKDINKNIQIESYLEIQENIMVMEINEGWNFKKV